MALKPYRSTAPQRTPQSSKKFRLLYVEDEDLNWEVTLLHLRERYDIERAVNSEEAFALLRARPFHAVLMDIQLANSEMDGTAITRALRGTSTHPLPEYARGVTFPRLPIIFVTAYSARYSRADLISLGGDELVTKPIDFTSLGLCLNRCLLKAP